MSLHASLVLARDDATRLRELFTRTGNFPDSAESLDWVLRASTQPSVAIVTTTNRINQITEWLKQHCYQMQPAEFIPIFEALHHALDFPFYEEHVNTSSSV
jgi:hypothetical protein